MIVWIGRNKVDPEQAELPEKVRQLAEALEANAKLVWDGSDSEDPEGDAKFVGDLVYVTRSDSPESGECGYWRICDNYDGRTGWGSVFVFNPADESWQLRYLYGETTKPYSFERAMADARIMFTG